MTPVVSVIIPFRGRIPWLREAVDSVLAQTFRNFELILVDDGSDEPAAFLDEIRDGRVRYIRQPPAGAAAARNLGIRYAAGKYVAFLDSDDLFLPTKLEFQLRMLEEHPHLVFSHTSYMRMDAAGCDLQEIELGKLHRKGLPRDHLRLRDRHAHGHGPRDILRDLKFEESVRIGEDVILWVRIARRHEILGIQKPLTRVRMHGKTPRSGQKPSSKAGGTSSVSRSAKILRFPPLSGGSRTPYCTKPSRKRIAGKGGT